MMITFPRRAMLGTLCGAVVAAPTWGASLGALADEGPYSLARTQHWRLPRLDAPDLTIWIAWPEGDAPVQGWPLAFVLDGEANFPLAAMARPRGAGHGREGGGLIVGLASGTLEQRIFDYTPAVAGYHMPHGVPGGGHRLGGGEHFLRLIATQVLPRIADRWRVDHDRLGIIGHSFGGLLALYAGMAGPLDVSVIAAVSPSFWYGDDLLQRMADALDEERQPVRALIACGESENGPGGASGALARRFVASVSPHWEMARFRSLGALGHGATMRAAMDEALDLALYPAGRG